VQNKLVNGALLKIQIFIRVLLVIVSFCLQFNLYSAHAEPVKIPAEQFSKPDYLKAAIEDARLLGKGGDSSKANFADLSESGSVARLKDITSLENVRSNQLVGYGLVVGLNGSGDTLRNSPFTEQSMRAMLENLGISPPPGASRANNIAAVIVTADLPSFARAGSRIDVSVSSLGDAKSLQGGSLVMTPLRGADGETYAVAQGNLVISGFTATGAAAKLTQGVPTTGRIPNGAIVERTLPGDFNELTELKLSLNEADFTTAAHISDLINEFTHFKYDSKAAEVLDARTVNIKTPTEVSTARFIAEIENLPIPVDEVARVVVDERTGTVVIGEKVRVSRVAIAHGSLTVKVTEDAKSSQPHPFSEGQTVILPHTNITSKEPPTQIGVFSGTSLDKLVKGLNQIGVKPSGIIAILQAIKTAGALHAELVVQ